jgi:lipopolysaccharide transport system permease protein
MPPATKSSLVLVDSASTELHPRALGEPRIIQPSGGWPTPNLRELLAYRSLFMFLVWREVKVKYAQTVLGVGWAVIQPVISMVVFTLIFGRFANIPSDGVPYPIFSLAGLTPWSYFSTALANSSNSLVAQSRLLNKIYLPRLILPTAPVVSGLVGFAIAFVILLAMCLAFGIVPSVTTLAVVPLLLVVMMLTASGMGYWLSALNVQYRDVKHSVPFMIQIWMYGSPIVYPLSLVPAEYRIFYFLNPMVGVVEGFRATLLGTQPVPWLLIATSLLIASVIWVAGAFYFRRTERIFADVA